MKHLHVSLQNVDYKFPVGVYKMQSLFFSESYLDHSHEIIAVNFILLEFSIKIGER